MKGATAYEYQVGRVHVRILRPKMYFWPYRHFANHKIIWPRVIGIYLLKDE